MGDTTSCASIEYAQFFGSGDRLDQAGEEVIHALGADGLRVVALQFGRDLLNGFHGETNGWP
jgi:hypothetical protein